jgi:hypothetical protein
MIVQRWDWPGRHGGPIYTARATGNGYLLPSLALRRTRTAGLVRMPGIEDFMHQQGQIINRAGWSVTLIMPTEEDAATTVPFASPSA